MAALTVIHADLSLANDVKKSIFEYCAHLDVYISLNVVTVICSSAPAGWGMLCAVACLHALPGIARKCDVN